MSTTPLTKLLYPLWYQQKLEKWRRGEIDWDGNPLTSEAASNRESLEKLSQTQQVRRLVVYLRLESLPGLFTFISLLGGEGRPKGPAEDATAPAASETRPRRPLEVHGIRMLELTERTSSVMQVTESDECAPRDPVVNTFRTFSPLRDVAVSGRVAVVPNDS